MTHYPLTKAQMGVYLECARHPESTQYNNPWSTLLDPVLDQDKIEQAIIKIFDARKELHLHFTEETDGTVCQYVSDAKLKVKRLDMTEDEAVRYQKEDFCRPFVLNGDEPLIRAEILVTEKNRYLLVDLHHLIADGTTDLFLFSHRDLSDAYEGKELKEYGYGLLDYAKDEAAQYAGSAYERDKTFYQNRFSGMTFATLSDGSEKEGRILFSSEMLSKDAIEDFCTKNEIAANIVFQAAFGYTLSVLIGEEKIMYIIENHGRYTKELSQSYGMFVNNTPVLSTINDRITVSEYLDQVRGEALLGMRHSHYPFLDLCSDMGVSTGAVFNFLAMEEVEESSFFGDKKCPFVQLNRNAAFSDLGVTIFKTPDNYEIRATSGEFQNSERILRLFTHAMKTVVLKMIEAPDSKITALSLVPDNETDKVLAVSEGDELVYEKDKTWVDLFLINAGRNPDAVAVKDAYGSFTYEELDRASDKVARYLIQRGVRNNDFVAVQIKRIREFVAAVLGINKAGAAYIPIDPEYPEERISYMITDSDAKCVITKESMTEILAMEDGSEPFVSRAKADDLAYMIYTSGTSGRPKGAMILHKGLSAFCAWNNQELKQNSTTSHLIQSSFSFDASVFDMIPPLVAGATVHIADEELRSDLPSLSEYINRNNITGLLVNTQIGMELIDHYDLKLSYLMLGGDTMLPVKTSSFTVYNAYGPTEFTAASSFYKLKGGENVIPIGRPVPGSASLICDRYGNLLPLGATGELCLLGIQMGAGYYKQPELTSRKFIKRNIRGIGEETLYRTGDLARYNEDGDLEFLGRIDNQIKLRGYRIELGEIESVAAWYEGVTGAVALLRNDSIVLYYTASKQIDKEEFREFLSGKLTEYMIPAVLMQLDEMPLTPGGKVDKKALPEPEYERKTAYEEPQTDTEKIISAFMAKILGLEDKVGRKDNFYELGGDSIMAIRLVSMLRQEGV
ncbi:MAG: amino acid adenylation domain-containing protein, partial [Butyrivibrio sp.]|uniref:non-ribosomal peptide synthetase n=1 Tax=Butyrivibrio sp. TaxID=28121 RepID=UPI0025BD5195